MRQINLELRFVRKQIRLFERSGQRTDDPLAGIEAAKSLDLDRQRHSARAAASRVARTSELRAGTNVERGERSVTKAAAP